MSFSVYLLYFMKCKMELGRVMIQLLWFFFFAFLCFQIHFYLHLHNYVKHF